MMRSKSLPHVCKGKFCLARIAIIILKLKLQKILARASKILSEHAMASGFTPVGLELGFGKGGELPPIVLPCQWLYDGGCGRIDRVDKAMSSGSILLRMVDYKSSDRNVQLSEVYYGLALQMLTYLDVIISNSRNAARCRSTQLAYYISMCMIR